MKILQVVTFLDPRFKCLFSTDIDVADINKDTLQKEGGKVLQGGVVIAQHQKVHQVLLLLQDLHLPRSTALVPFSRILQKNIRQFFYPSSKGTQS